MNLLKWPDLKTSSPLLQSPVDTIATTGKNQIFPFQLLLVQYSTMPPSRDTISMVFYEQAPLKVTRAFYYFGDQG